MVGRAVYPGYLEVKLAMALVEGKMGLGVPSSMTVRRKSGYQLHGRVRAMVREKNITI